MPRPRARAASAVAVALLALAALAAMTAESGVTAAAPTEPGGVRLTLVAQDPWTPLGGDVTLRIAATGAPADATLTATAYQAVSSRKGFEAAMAGGNAGSVQSQTAVPWGGPDPLDADGARTVRIGLQSPTAARDPARLNLRRPGVYPVDVELRDADEGVLAAFRTPVVVSETAGRASVAAPLSVVWVWPLETTPTRLPDGSPDRSVTAALRTDGRLGRQLAALRAIPDVAVTLAPAADTLQGWSEAGRDDVTVGIGADTARAVVVGRTHLAGTFVPVDQPSLLADDAEAVTDQIARAEEILGAFIGPSLDRTTRLVHPASTSAVVRARIAGATTVVIDADALAPVAEPRLTPAQPVMLRAPVFGGAETVAALVTEPSVQAALTTDRAPALRAQTVLAGLVVIALEVPSTPRVITMVTPPDLDAPAPLYTALLAGLRDNPFLQAVPPGTALATVAADPAERALADPDVPPPPVSATAYRTVRDRIAALSRLVGPADPTVVGASRNLLSSVADAVDRAAVPSGNDGYLRAADRPVDEFLARIEVPSPGTITLTSRSGEIPLTFRNGTGAPVRVRVDLASDRLTFPDGDVVEIDLPPRSTTVRVAVETRGSGTFPVELSVTSTDGVLTVARERFQVRSTYVSRVGLVLLVSAVVILAAWWGLDLRRRRRRRAGGRGDA